jgi:excisionase family DNA binding protein
MADTPALLDVAGAAARLGVSPRFIRYQIAARTIRHLKVGRYVRFRPEDVDAFAERRVRDVVA